MERPTSVIDNVNVVVVDLPRAAAARTDCLCQRGRRADVL